jgi:hypothetical protein
MSVICLKIGSIKSDREICRLIVLSAYIIYLHVIFTEMEILLCVTSPL